MYFLINSFFYVFCDVFVPAAYLEAPTDTWPAPGRWILPHQRDPPAGLLANVHKHKNWNRKMTKKAFPNFLPFLFWRYLYTHGKWGIPSRCWHLMQPVFCWKMVTKQTWNILFLTCSCLSRWTNQYCATARSSQAMPQHRKQNSGFVPKALSYFTIIMLLGICQALQNQLLNSFSTQMHGQALFIIHTGWFYMTGKQLDGGKLCVSGCPSPGTRNPSHIWPNQCAACSQNGAKERSVLVGKPWQPNLAI